MVRVSGFRVCPNCGSKAGLGLPNIAQSGARITSSMRNVLSELEGLVRLLCDQKLSTSKWTFHVAKLTTRMSRRTIRWNEDWR